MNTLKGELQNSAGQDDRRRHKRFRFAIPISVRFGDGAPIPAMTLEISEGGLSAVLASPLNLGGTVQLESVAPGAISAQVSHKVGKIYGFEFLKLTEEQATRLRFICGRLPRYPDNKLGI